MLEATPIPTALGEFEVVRRIGRGGMGVVLEVRSRSTGSTHAAKLIVRANDPLARERFRREAEFLARCDRHPGVVKVHSFGETPDGSLYMIMDLVRGENLDDLLEREPILAPARAAAIVRDVALALGHAHALGIVHRDVKPSNVLMTADGEVKLTDFGLATACDLEALTRTGQFVGTMRFASPEQAIGPGRPGPPTDVFALGTVLFLALTGRTPFEELRTPVEIMRELGTDEAIPDVRGLAPTCPEALAQIVARAVRKAPAERYATGSELARDLTLFLEGKPTSVSGAGSPPPRSRRAPALVGLGAFAILGLGVALLPGLTRASRAKGVLGDATLALERARATLALRATEANLAQALEDASRARVLALAADSLGATGATDVAREAALSATAARAGLAEAQLGAGRSHDARRLLATVDGAPASLTPLEQLLLARARFLEGGLDASATNELLALPGLGPRHAEALELAGDSLAARGEVAAATSAYAAALEASSGPRAALRLKHGVAAVRAQDDTSGLTELKTLVPDLAKLASERAKNARLAGFAPALYRRGLASQGESGERDLEAAWRLAEPPPELAAPLARRWISVAEPTLRAWNDSYGTDSSVVELPLLKHPIALSARARQLDPACESQVVWKSFALIDNWAARSGVDAALAERVGRGLLEGAREPVLLHMVARCSRRQRSDRVTLEECVALEQEAIDRFPDLRADEPIHVARLAFAIADAFVSFLAENELDLDLERLRRIAGRGDGVGFHVEKAVYHRLRNRSDLALEELALAPPPGNDELFGLKNAEERLIVFFALGRVDDATHFLETGAPGFEGRLRGKLRDLCKLGQAELPRIPLARDRARKLLAIGQGRVFLGELSEAAEALEAIQRLGATPEAQDLEARIARARAAR